MALDAENDLPPWAAVYQQTQRWLAAGCFEALVDDLRAVLRLAAGRTAEPSAAIIDSRTLRSTPESGERAGYDGGKRKKGSKLHMAVDTLGHLLALHVTPASAEDRGEVERLARTMQTVTGDNVDIAYVDQGYTGARAANAAAHGITLEVIKLPEAKRGFVLLPRRWVVERSLASPQGLCARQRFGGHNENTGYATSLRRAMGSLRVRNSPGESRFALCHR